MAFFHLSAYLLLAGNSNFLLRLGVLKRRFRGRKGLRKSGVEAEAAAEERAGCGEGWPRCRGAAGGVSVAEDCRDDAAEGSSWGVVSLRSCNGEETISGLLVHVSINATIFEMATEIRH